MQQSTLKNQFTCPTNVCSYIIPSARGCLDDDQDNVIMMCTVVKLNTTTVKGNFNLESLIITNKKCRQPHLF